MPKTALKPDQKPQRKKFDHRGAGTIRPVPRLANAGTPDKPAVSLGVSTFLPPIAAQILVDAADKARGLPEIDLKRAKIIGTAIERVRRGWPEYFRQG
ncbi:hypothetical protein [uncultured Sutterella sp.]|uniref:hypothetical protein n=1 Tax=uncultured Sutterella sp. TaxID=286133 RepID=UPI00267087E2|nr:hypothetical protein [uncultured Sutterella sp.]